MSFIEYNEPSEQSQPLNNTSSSTCSIEGLMRCAERLGILNIPIAELFYYGLFLGIGLITHKLFRVGSARVIGATCFLGITLETMLHVATPYWLVRVVGSKILRAVTAVLIVGYLVWMGCIYSPSSHHEDFSDIHSHASGGAASNGRKRNGNGRFIPNE